MLQRQKRGRFPDPSAIFGSSSLTLGELEGLAGLGLAILLALDNAAIAGQEATLLEHWAQARLEEVESLGDTVTHGAGLTGQTAAGHRDDNVVLVGAFGCHDWLLDDQLQHGTRKVCGELTAVDRDSALAWLDPDPGNRVLALAGGIGTTLGVELLNVHRCGVDDRSDGGGAEVFEGVDGFGHITSPAHFWGSSQQRPAWPGPALHGDARRQCRRGDSSAAHGSAGRPASCGERRSRARAQENDLRGSRGPSGP